MSRRAAAAVALVAAACVAQPVPGQDLAQRVAAAGDGQVRLSFAARPGVCGDGQGSIRTGDENWTPDCEPGPVRVALEVRGGRVRDVESYLGGR